MSNLPQVLVVEPVMRNARQRSGNSPDDETGRDGQLAVSHANHASSENGATPPSQQQTTWISDVDATAESPSEEQDEASVLDGLIDGRNATGGFSVHSRSRRPPGSGSYSSFRSWRSLTDDRMSINPASLSNPSSLSLVNLAQSDTSSASTRSRANTGQATIDGVGEGRHSVPQRRNDASKMEGSLPDDDGMRSLRQQLQEIKNLAISTEEKAQRMHYLMTQDYLAHKAHANILPSSDDPAPPAMSSLAPPVDLANPYSIRHADLESSFSPLPVVPRDPSGDQDEAMDEDLPPALGCMHYKRNVKVQCFDCHRWYTCRHCHDQSPDLPFPHQLNRKRTQNMLCMLCLSPQPAAEMCIECGELSAWYYCAKCKLWDNDSNKRIYHCDDCGICRVGEGLGRDFVHCRRCNVCISISTSASHPCIERATEGDCPLCLVRLFESPTPVVSLPCGHYMHGECYRDLMAVTYKCPVCSKSAVNMELQWRKLDDEIRAQPMPEDDRDLEGLLPHIDTAAEETAANVDIQGSNMSVAPRRPRTVYIGCNDCSRRSWAPFHWLGLKCQVCDSYNTNQMAPTAFQETEAERLIRQQQQQQQHRQHDFTGDAVLRDAGIGADDQLAANTTLLDVPTSPSQQPVASDTEGRASGPHSPRRRYFVQEEEQRRPSLSTPRFSTPSIPTLPNLPELPRMPRMPHLPNMPDMPNIGLPRFLPYEMLDAVSRGLSPMRYYLQGFDVRDEDIRVSAARNRSPTSVRSDPTADATASKRRASEAEDDVGLWGSDGHVHSGEDDDGTDDSIHAVDRDEETSSSDSDETSDAEMAEDDLEGGDDDDEFIALFGHR